jgi:hypothetical protein
MVADFATVVFVPERGCRMSSVEAAAEAFRRYASAKSLRVSVVVSNDISDARSRRGHFAIRTMEGQERHGRHAPLVADIDNEMYVELASYLYDSAPTKNIIKFEMNAVNYEHPLTQTFFCEVARCVPAVATGTVPSANAETLLRSGHASPQEPNESCCCW